jgi:hypothetical protein
VSCALLTSAFVVAGERRRQRMTARDVSLGFAANRRWR